MKSYTNDEIVAMVKVVSSEMEKLLIDSLPSVRTIVFNAFYEGRKTEIDNQIAETNERIARNKGEAQG